MKTVSYPKNNGWHRGTALSLIALAASPALAQVAWTGAGADTDWSTAENWTASPSGQDVLFANAGAGGSASTVTSVVDGDYTLTGFSMDYMDPAEANTTTYQNISINAGKTLTVNGSFSVGATSEPSSYVNTNYAHTNYLTVGGTGSLVVDGGGTGTFTILPENTGTAQFRYMRMATLNMQELSSFSATNLDKFVFGADRSGGASWSASFARLALSNTIQANTLVMDGYSGASRMEFGVTNILHVDNILIGQQSMDVSEQTWSQGAATMIFRSGVAGATVEIRGSDGVSAADILVGRSGLPYLGPVTGVSGSGTLNLEGGTTDAKVNNLVVGLADQGTTNLTSGTAVSGTMVLGAGLMEAANVVLGRTTTGNTNTNAGITADATLTIKNYGVMDVSGDMILGDAQQSYIALTSTVNLELGTLKAASIRTGANAAGNKTVVFNWNQNTTIQNHAGSDLSVGEGVDLTLLGTGTHIFNIDAAQSGTVDSSILGEGGITKTGEGTLVLNSTGNSFTGATVIADGRLIVNGSLGTSALTLQSEAILRLTTTTIVALDWDGNAIIEADLGSIGAGMTVTGSFDPGADGAHTFDFMGAGVDGETYTLISGWASTGFTADDFSFTNLAAGLTGTFEIAGDALTFTAAAVPEPEQIAFCLLAAGALLVSIVRRRVCA
jgi:autotransporter-associated beta strand protein